MYPDAVIFDFDGVIVDTEPLHHQAFQQVLEPLSMGFSWQDYVEVYMGFDDRDAFREAFRQAGKPLTDDTLRELIKQKAAFFDQIIAKGVAPYPGVLELIKDLTTQQIPLAISSGALRSDILPIITLLGISDCFSTIVTADDVPQSKPDPASYLKAKAALINTYSELLSENSTFFAIEDTPAGIQSATSAGLKVIAVTNSYPEEKLTQASLQISSLEQLVGGNWPVAT